MYVNSEERKQIYGDKDMVTLRDKNGLVNFSPITQVLTLLYEYAVHRHFSEYVHNADYVTGHSLGEYMVPLLVVNMPIEKCLILVFMRGMAMINGLGDGETYRMVSINPQRIGKRIEDLKASVNRTSGFVEIVNHHVRNQQ